MTHAFHPCTLPELSSSSAAFIPFSIKPGVTLMHLRKAMSCWLSIVDGIGGRAQLAQASPSLPSPIALDLPCRDSTMNNNVYMLCMPLFNGFERAFVIPLSAWLQAQLLEAKLLASTCNLCLFAGRCRQIVVFENKSYVDIYLAGRLITYHGWRHWAIAKRT